MKEFDEYISIVNKAIENLKLPANPAGLYDPIRYTLGVWRQTITPGIGVGSL